MIKTTFKNSVIAVEDNNNITITLEDQQLELNADEVVQFFQLAGAMHQVANQRIAAAALED